MQQKQPEMRILVSVGGGPEAYASLAYAARFARRVRVDTDLLYVRPLDSGLRSGGLETRVARQNMLEWGLELPGMTRLKKALDTLKELGEVEDCPPQAWTSQELSGDSAGEYTVSYTGSHGGTITLRLRTSNDVAGAVADECARLRTDLAIIGGTHPPRTGLRKFLTQRPLCLQIAAHAPCSVIIARNLTQGHGHLVCLEDSDRSRAMLHKVADYAEACECNICLLSVARDEKDEHGCRTVLNEAVGLFRERGVTPSEVLLERGDPVDVIVEKGVEHSLTVMADAEKPWFTKAFSVAHEVAARAASSVMIVR